MKKLFIMAAICLTGCAGPDKVPFAVFDAVPVEYNEDLEPVYIDLTDVKDYRVGDTIEVNGNGRIPYKEILIRDGETKQLIKPKDWHWVVLDRRLPVDSLFTRDDAEDGQ